MNAREILQNLNGIEVNCCANLMITTCLAPCALIQEYNLITLLTKEAQSKKSADQTEAVIQLNDQNNKPAATQAVSTTQPVCNRKSLLLLNLSFYLCAN